MSNSNAKSKRRVKNNNQTTTAASPRTTSNPGKRKIRARKVGNLSETDSENGRGGGVEDIEDMLMFKEEEIDDIRASLLDWYDQNRRDLPWRRLADDNQGKEEDGGGGRRAYAVWVSEVMLQQTRVATVIDYFDRWMKKWPSINHLSLASLEEVNEVWAGLGYYRRARYLLEGAKKITDEGCKFPRTVSALRKVPGIGNYTAGAIASIAFNEAVPVVDGNVVRVLARLKAISANPKDSVTVKKFWKLAEQLVDPCRPGDFNQAIMEFGAIICTPTGPNCSNCPVSGQCHALSMSHRSSSLLVTDFPQKVIKAKKRNEFSAVCVLEISKSLDMLGAPCSNSWYLLVKRPEEGLLAGLWEFPSVLLEQDFDTATRRGKIDHFLNKSFNLDARKTRNVIMREDVGEYIHIFSHIRLKMYVELLILHVKDGTDLLSRKMDDGTVVWKCVDSKELSNMGLTSGIRKVYTMVQRFKQNISTLNFVPQKSAKKHRVILK
ncbi:hypothetical protein Ancab_020023 [Ancistrocladus abbreviatus]